MDIDRIYHVSNRPPPVADWRSLPADGTRAFVARDAPPLPLGQALPRLKELWTYRLDRAALEALLAASSLELLSVSGSHVADLGLLRPQQCLRGLAIDWNNKAGSIDFLGDLDRLEMLSLQHLNHVHDLAPLATLANLRALQIAGGMDTRMEIDSLDPLAGLGLVELRLANVRIRAPGSMRSPRCRCWRGCRSPAMLPRWSNSHFCLRLCPGCAATSSSPMSPSTAAPCRAAPIRWRRSSGSATAASWSPARACRS
jgi:hypothetical protein